MHINYYRSVKENYLGRTGMLLLILVISVAALSPFLSTYCPDAESADLLQPPSRKHWLGTNDVGQDVWSRLVYGAKNSLLVGFGAGAIATLISTVTGTSAALIGGKFEAAVMRLVDALIAIPSIVLIILVAAYVRPSASLLILLLALLTWQGGARVVRAQALALKLKTHITAARSFGAGWPYIVMRHIIPDLSPILLVSFIMSARRAVFMEAGLSFLGISAPGTVSWGSMIYHALQFCHLQAWKWWLIPAGLSLSITIMSLVFIGHALEETIDPRLRGDRNA